MKKTFLTLSISILFLSACQQQAPIQNMTNDIPPIKTEEKVNKNPEPSETSTEESEPTVFNWPFTFDEEVPELQVQINEGCEKTYDQDGIRFNYRCEWELNPEGWNHSGILLVRRDKTPPGTIVHLELLARSFEAYEKEFESVIVEPVSGMGMSVKEKQLTVGSKTYPIKEYGQHHGLTYIVEMDGNYVEFGSDTVLSEKELEGVYVILSSIEF